MTFRIQHPSGLEILDSRGERVAKYDRLVEIEHASEIGYGLGGR